MKLGRVVSRAGRAVVGFVASPIILGALYVSWLAWRAWRAPFARDERALGRDAQAIAELVQRFGPEQRRAAIAIGAAAIVIGALLGALAALLVRLRDRMARRAPRSRMRLAFTALVTTAVLHAWLMLFAMARTPQLFEAAWYARGGARRTAQVLATDVLGPSGVVVLGVVLLAAFLAGPPSVWPTWPGRLRRAFLPHGPSWRRRASLASVSATASIAIALLGVVAFAPLSERAANADGERPNVLVIAVDSLRADRITPRVAPHLDALAARGTRFDRAYVSLARAAPSWVTLLSGRHPHHHGVRSTFARWEERAKDFDTVPQRLAQTGYRTRVLSDGEGDVFRRIDLGFERVLAPASDLRQLVRERTLEREPPLLPLLQSRTGRRVFPAMRDLPAGADPSILADDAIAALDEARGAPFFLTVFFSATHFPYAAPAPFYDRFTRPSYRGRFKYAKPVAVGPTAPPDPEDIAQIRGLYDGAVASVDDAAGRIVAALARRGLDRSTIVVLTSDHGETLFENGRGQGHGDHLFGDEGTHVPLVIVDPRHPEGHRERRVARDVDLAPTIYELTGVAPPPDLDGRSLVPALAGASLEALPAYAETELWMGDLPAVPPELRMPVPPLARITELDPAHGDEIVLGEDARAATLVARHRMVRDERWKLVYVPTRSHVTYMLFDTERDPGETHDVAADHAPEVARLKGDLWRWMLRDPQMIERDGFLVSREVPKERP